MTQSRHLEHGVALLFAGVFLLMLWQPQRPGFFWPLVMLSAVGIGYGLVTLAPADRARRTQAWWAVPLALGSYAWLAQGLGLDRSLQLAGLLVLFGVVLIWARRRAA